MLEILNSLADLSLIVRSCKIFYNQWSQNLFRKMYRKQHTLGKDNAVCLLLSLLTKSVINVSASAAD